MTVASLCGPTCGAHLYVHVLGALTLFGSMLTITVLAFAALGQSPERAALLRRVAFWMTLGAAVPAWIVMYFGGYWLLDHEGLDDNTVGWARTGILIAHLGAALLLLLLILGWLARTRPRLGPVLAALASLYLVALGVAWFAMSAKPSW